MRGNLPHAGYAYPYDGSIPACAGKPSSQCESLALAWVYPRVCGETMIAQPSSVRNRGLSPRVRGNHRHPAHIKPSTRSIPACAGKPCSARSRPQSLRVYPRVCGETSMKGLPTSLIRGLSPRVRGNLDRLDLGPVLRGSIPACAGKPDGASYARTQTPRSIPACAGKPLSPHPPHGTLRVYPRVCGETLQQQPAGYLDEGLSPRVRGNPISDWPFGYFHRSIPACAGKPFTPVAMRLAYGVYPRVCGETPVVTLVPHLHAGLSPRVRGN